MRKHLLLVLSCCFAIGAQQSKAQYVTLALGNPGNSGTPAGVAPWAAGEKWNTPEGICFDKNGHLWIVDKYNKQIRVQFSGENTTRARAGIYTNGSALGTSLDDQSGTGARFNNAAWITSDKNGDLYFTEQGGFMWPYDTRIRKIQRYTTLGNAQAVSTINMGSLRKPTGIAVDQNFNLYVADEDLNVIFKFDQSGNILDQYGVIDSVAPGFMDGPKTVARFKYPRGLAIDTINNYLYVADYANYRIRRIDLSNGNVTTVSGDYYPGNGKSANFPGNKDIDTNQTYVRAPNGIALGKNNELFITCIFNVSQIRVLNLSTNKIRTIAGKFNTPGYQNGDTTATLFDAPFGIAVSPDNTTLYVTEQGDNGDGHIIRKIQLNPMCDFSASNVNPVTGENIWLNDASKNRPTQWLWTITPTTYNIDQNNINSQNIRVNFTATGLYQVKFWCKNAYGADSLTRVGYINVSAPAGNPPVAAFTTPFVAGTVDSVFSFSDISSNTPTQWRWRFTPDNVQYVQGDSTTQNIKVKFLSVGLYTVELIATNTAGSDNEKKINYISVNYNTSVVENNLLNANVYPNPANDYILLNKVNENQGRFTLVDINGKVLLEQDLQQNSTRISTAELPAGLYFWNYTEENWNQSGRILISR